MQRTVLELAQAMVELWGAECVVSAEDAAERVGADEDLTVDTEEQWRALVNGSASEDMWSDGNGGDTMDLAAELEAILLGGG